MKSNSKGRGAYSVVAAGALVLGLAACDQIQSLWKSEEKANPAVGSVTPPKNKLLANKIKAALGADPALKVLAIDAAVADGAVTLYGTANNRALRERAAKVVADVPGVKSVKNELVIVAGS